MVRILTVSVSLGLVMGLCGVASANLLVNGNLDRVYDQEIVPGFFLPKPDQWVNNGSRSISGPYEDEMSSEGWAGPAPTPVTADGFNVTTGLATNDPDNAVFFKPFSGNATNGLATGHLFQDVAGTAGLTYQLTGWAGAEANALMADAVFAIDFINAAGGTLSSVQLSLLPTLYTVNGQAFNYKFYSLSGVAPVGTSFIRARASMLDAQSNPLGGGQAFVVDDFDLTVVPEPASLTALGIGALALIRKRRAAKKS